MNEQRIPWQCSTITQKSQYAPAYKYNINIMNEGKTLAIAELAIRLYCSDLHIVELSLTWSMKDPI